MKDFEPGANIVELFGTRNKKSGWTAMPKKSPRLPTRLNHAEALRQSIAAGQATPDEARDYQRILNVFRAKFRAGGLSPQHARRFGIED